MEKQKAHKLLYCSSHLTENSNRDKYSLIKTTPVVLWKILLYTHVFNYIANKYSKMKSAGNLENKSVQYLDTLLFIITNIV